MKILRRPHSQIIVDQMLMTTTSVAFVRKQILSETRTMIQHHRDKMLMTPNTPISSRVTTGVYRLRSCKEYAIAVTLDYQRKHWQVKAALLCFLAVMPTTLSVCLTGVVVA